MENPLRPQSRPNDLEQRMEKEMEFHIEELTEAFIKKGLTPEEARKAALREFGNVEALKEECRDSWGTRTLDTFIRNLKFAFRQLGKQKGFTATIILTLALCIGGNASIFTMLNTLILQPLPYSEPDRIVEVYNTYPLAGLPRASSNVPIYLDYSENTDTFSHLALLSGFAANIGESGSPERIQGNRVTHRFFNVFGVVPEVGSFFREEHNIQGQHRFVVLSYSYWMNRYGGDPDVVGQQIQMNDQPFEILGVAPRSLEGLYRDAQVYVAMAWNPQNVNPMARHGNGPRLLGRLKADASLAQAKSQIDARDRIYYDETPQIQDFLDRSGHVSMVRGLQKERVRGVESVLYLLQIGALFVLAIGCVNIANLLLIRSNSRQTEFAIRSAVGGRPMDLGRQLLTESVLLSVCGGAVGALFSIGGVHLINTYAMDMLPPMQPLSLDLNTLLFALGLAIGTGLIVGLFPVARANSLKLVNALNHTSRGSSASRASQLVSSGLVCGQVSLALMLLVGAGLLIHSFGKILSQDFGFDAENVSTLRLSLSQQQYPENENVHGLQNDLIDAIRGLPSVESVGIAQNVPMTTGYSYNTFSIYGYTMADGEEQLVAHHTRISPEYFDALGIKIIAGEGFGPSDIASSRNALLIDKTLADRYYPNESPIGRRLGFVGPNTPEEDWPTVIGVTEVAQHTRIDGIQGAPFIYRNIYLGASRNFSVFIKSGMSHELLVPMIRDRLKEINPSLPLFLSGPLSDFVDDSLNNKRAVMLLLAVFAGIAVTLSSIGIYGVMAYNVSQQSREIGTRAALGATRGQVISLFMKRGVIKAGIGLVIGLVGAFALSRFMTSMLYEVEPTEPIVYIALTLILFSISLLASYLPSLKAARIHPMEAMRAD